MNGKINGTQFPKLHQCLLEVQGVFVGSHGANNSNHTLQLKGISETRYALPLSLQ